MEKADSVSLERGPVADVLTVTGKAEGVRALKQTVMLYHDLSRVDFGIWMDKPRRSAAFVGSLPSMKPCLSHCRFRSRTSRSIMDCLAP